MVERLRSETERGERPMAFSPRSQRVLEAARSEASGGEPIGTEYLLRALATADDGLAAEVLKESGVE